MKLDRVVQRDHSVFTMAVLSGTGGAPAAVTDGSGAAHEGKSAAATRTRAHGRCEEVELAVVCVW